jgi:hypothetical protein
MKMAWCRGCDELLGFAIQMQDHNIFFATTKGEGLTKSTHLFLRLVDEAGKIVVDEGL